MPIGKNAIKRVENNGYSNVKTEAPDMINSTVIGATSPEVIKMVEKSVEAQAKKVEAPQVKAEVKPTAKKPAAKTANKPATKKAPVKKAAKNDNF